MALIRMKVLVKHIKGNDDPKKYYPTKEKVQHFQNLHSIRMMIDEHHSINFPSGTQ